MCFLFSKFWAEEKKKRVKKGEEKAKKRHTRVDHVVGISFPQEWIANEFTRGGEGERKKRKKKRASRRKKEREEKEHGNAKEKKFCF